MQNLADGEPALAQRSKLPALGSDFFPGVAGLTGLIFLLDGPSWLSRGTCNPSTSVSTSPPLEQKTLVRLNENTDGIENVKLDGGGTIGGRTCGANRMTGARNRGGQRYQQVVDHPFRARSVRTNVKVTDRAELGSHCRRDVDGLAYEGLDIRRRVAKVGRYAPAEHPMLSGRHLFPERRVVS